MKNTIVLMILLAIIPSFLLGRTKDKAKNTEHSAMFVIQPGEEMEEEEDLVHDYYPGDNGIKTLKKTKDNGQNWKWWEIRFDGSLAKGLGEMSDTNGSYHLSGLYHYSPEFAFGAATGVYYSVGPYATHSVPLLALADYNFPSYMGFTPYVEAFGGLLIGFKNASLGCDAPNCGIFGIKGGIAYNLYKSIQIRFAINYFNTTDNRSKKHGNTAESCIGPCGSIGYRF